MGSPIVPDTGQLAARIEDSWTRAWTSQVAPVWDCVSDRRPYCRLVRETPGYSRSIETCSVAANCVAMSASSAVSSAARIERSRSETVAGSVAATAVVVDDDDDSDEDWSRFESWVRARQRS